MVLMLLMQSSKIAEIKGRPDLVPLYILLDAHADGAIVGPEIKLRAVLTGEGDMWACINVDITLSDALWPNAI